MCMWCEWMVIGLCLKDEEGGVILGEDGNQKIKNVVNNKFGSL